jgi:hypothetical protein
MPIKVAVLSRVFKTTWFAKASKKAGISDDQLCIAIAQVMRGQAADLGGGVFKQRLNDNRHRSIILAKGGRYWIYEYLFAKQDRDNIDVDELAAFRVLAKKYGGLTDVQVTELVEQKFFVEICNDDESKI